ncbi:MAG: NAD-dependent succinate-semialdehyde dehydrogenase [Sphingobacteriaceae bacterium]|nr:NAD-dependent succinate-semialdehyde dehydrogenase [Sphingobacteriaceae bacterium]
MLQSVHPYTGEVLQSYPVMGAQEVEAVLQQSQQAFFNWKAMPLADRLAFFSRLIELMRIERDQLALLATMEMGKLLVEAKSEVDKCMALCAYYLEHAEEQLAPEERLSDARQSGVLYQPLGVILGIMPWNFPFWQAFRFLVPTLIAGNTAVLKHASNVSGCALAIEQLFIQAGFPANCMRTLLLPGAQMQQVVQHALVAGVSLTGSEAVGRQVGGWAGAALKPMVLELGGNDPFLVFEDADLELAAKTAMQSRFQNAGQSCIAAKRFIVQQRVYDAFLLRCKEIAEGYVLGDPKEAQTSLAPLANGSFVDELAKQVEHSVAEGAEVFVGGGKWPQNEAFYLPTILTGVRAHMLVAKEELFGPVAVVMSFTTPEQAIALANDSKFGLGATIFTQDLEIQQYCLNNMESGSVFINGLMKSHPGLPFGGIKASGLGRELSKEGLRAFVNLKTYWNR